MRLLSALLIALSIVAAPIIWNYTQSRFTPPSPPPPDIGPLKAEIAALREEMTQLQSRIDGLDARTSLGLLGADHQNQPEAAPGPAAPDPLKDSFAQVVLIADRPSVNDGLTVATPSFLSELFGGPPRADLTDDCQSATNQKLQSLIATENVGPIEATMIRPALASLRQIFANVQVVEPELYARIKTSGSLCVRRIRGSDSSASAHGYGLAVDINVDGQLDNFADGKTQLGLILMSDYFKKEGWIWGAGFSREDSMHFEVSREKLEQWRRLGEL